MTRERWQQVCDLLEEALELPPQQRPVLLDRACGADRSLRQEVEVLLASSDHMRSGFLQGPPLLEEMIPQTESYTSHVLTPGAKLGPYLIQSLIGSGGMGEVYRARDTELKREVAIKVLPGFWSRDSERLQRFELEAQAAAALNHPNIVAIHHVGQHHGSPYIVTELLQGETLRERLRRGPIPLRKAVEYAVQIAHGLAAAHDRGIVHRDLKPENLFVTKDGRVKILDFGLARLGPSKEASGEEATVTQRTDPGVVLGTAAYMSPEQVCGRTVDHRADIFAFGSILYEIVTGKQPFRKSTSAETMTAILNEEPPPVSQVAPNTPPVLQRIVQLCLEKAPESRFQSARDLGFVLDMFVDTSVPLPIVAYRAAWARRSWVWAATAVAVIALVSTIGPRLWATFFHKIQVVGTRTLSSDGAGSKGLDNETQLLQSGFTQEVNLFEAGWGDIPRTDRRYAIVFDGSTARFISWELHLKFPKAEPAASFGIKAVYTKSGDVQIAVQNQTCQIEDGDLETWCTYGWGSRNPGGWDPGNYKIELYLAGTKIAGKSSALLSGHWAWRRE